MKKKIKNLTREERLKICNEHVYDKCDRCPFLLISLFDDKSYYCVHHILNVLEREVEVK